MEVLETGQDEKWTREITDPSTKSKIKITATDVMYIPLDSYYILYNGRKIYLADSKGEWITDVPGHVKKDAELRYWTLERQKKEERWEEIDKERTAQFKFLKNLFLTRPLKLGVALAILVLILRYFNLI